MANEENFRFSVRSSADDNGTVPVNTQLNSKELGFHVEPLEGAYTQDSVSFPAIPKKLRLYSSIGSQVSLVGVGDALTLDNHPASNYARTDISPYFQRDIHVHGTSFLIAEEAKYADIAEYYETDKTMEPGDILMIGTDTESVIADGTMPLMGVCSTKPAYLMNSDIGEQEDEDGVKLFTHFAPIALKGRVPVNITGSAKRGDYIVVDKKNPGKGKAVKVYPKTDADKILVGLCITAGKGTCEVKV